MENVRMTIWVMVVCVMALSGVVLADIFGTGANQFTIDFVTISGSTNPTSGIPIGSSFIFTGVGHGYRIGTYEITNDQWNKFVNAYGTVTGSPSGAYDESVYWTSTNVPINNLSWYECAQFVNWLNMCTGHQVAYNFTGTQGTGDYTLGIWESGDVGYDASNPFRNSNAFYFLPTEDEFIKAAYWNGTGLQTYATKPGNTLYQGNGSNGGWNYKYRGFATDPYGPWDVGSGSEELNGTFDMMGNILEWLESPHTSGDYWSGSHRSVRGGSFTGGDDEYDGYDLMLSNRLFPYPPGTNGSDLGFRVASVPEPATLLLFGLGGLFLRRKQ